MNEPEVTKATSSMSLSVTKNALWIIQQCVQSVDKAASRSIASCAAFLSFFIKYKCKSENKEKMTYY